MSRTMRQVLSGRSGVPATPCSTWNSGWPVPARSRVPSGPGSSAAPMNVTTCRW
ncbi:MAG: hypothetical protein ACJ73S_26755 [Mycobacteriales bacterium]